MTTIPIMKKKENDNVSSNSEYVIVIDKESDYSRQRNDDKVAVEDDETDLEDEYEYKGDYDTKCANGTVKKIITIKM